MEQVEHVITALVLFIAILVIPRFLVDWIFWLFGWRYCGYGYYRIKNLSGKKCKACGEGRLRFDGEMKWNEGSRYEIEERFFRCGKCGKVFKG